MLDQDMESVGQFRQLAINILARSQPAAVIESRAPPARFKLAPKKLRPVRNLMQRREEKKTVQRKTKSARLLRLARFGSV